MGAHNFHDSSYGESPKEAYDDAVSNALFEYGHNPYNGTISTTNGFVVIPLREFETLDEWEERVLDDNRVRKWDACACVRDPNVEEENGRSLYHFVGWAAS